MTSLSAMKELVLVIKKTKEGLFTSDANIEACRKELLYILNQKEGTFPAACCANKLFPKLEKVVY